MRTSQNHPAEETKPFEGVGSVKVDDKTGSDVDCVLINFKLNLIEH